ncbi:XdhC family protein [Luteipulveratus halotolerans]|uniref:XshC-Cox1 family protein n=1 Tax=Luteipulveratus halotolerans TaxID=1631356 RepID=A0A0L6CGC6_9MICO|nr:XdhC/CoxI family protein [Luteipulveratus halotolerans]KNX36568.1 hypothetical protein VV01_04430 [Luteipulveratus halotolerans]
MLDALQHLSRCWDPASCGVLATVVDQEGSAPLEVGTSMTVDAAGRPHGSISGGCVDGDVYETALDVLRSGRPVLRRYGPGGSPFAASLTCGGSVEVLVHRVDPDSPLRSGSWADAGRARSAVAVTLRGDRAAVLAEVGSTRWGTLGDQALDDAVLRDHESGPHSYAGASGPVRVFVWAAPPPPRLLLVGANAVTAALSRLGAELGYLVTVCDQREVFTGPSAFPAAEEVVVQWPHRYLEAEAAGGRIDDRTVICVLTHDERVDAPTLRTALRLNAVGYVGAMGSRTTHHDRVRRLGALGVTAPELSRLSSPIGLDLGARTPAEIALSILAEVTAVRTAASGRPLTTRTGPIHAAADPRSACSA